MARPKSENKRHAILSAATKIFAERGPAAAPTAEISRRAGVAEGTLFTYFKSKADLIDVLYRQIRSEIAEAVREDFPHHKKLRRQLRHVWNRYVRWGVAHPERQKAFSHLEMSDSLTAAARQEGSDPFAEVQMVVNEMARQDLIRRDLSREFITRVFITLAVATMEFTVLHPETEYGTLSGGFKLFWKGITRK